MTAHVIWIIVGQCGEYSDHTQWNVCWRQTEAEALAVVAVLNGEAVDAKIEYDATDYDWTTADKRAKTMADPFYQNDYTETKYHCEALADDARAFEAEKAVRR
ncbi:MAG: hypothetical protein H0X39_13600 [Actinobacteria bacterium]|nr:hypothetical protein [Actinomycetota bacterium]